MPKTFECHQEEKKYHRDPFFYKVILPTPHLASISKASLDFESALALAIFQFSVDPVMMLDPHESTLMVSIRSITQEVCLG